VASGAFGACLMREPALVAHCVAAMRARVRVPVTVKMRIGWLAREAREALSAVPAFKTEISRALRALSAIEAAGCAVAIVHARKAVLGRFVSEGEP
jgi:tRNA-dihydrouridine synthase A